MKTESITINGKTIRAKYCSCLMARIEDKKFNLYLREVFIRDKNNFDVSITEDKIITLLNEAVSFEITKDIKSDLMFLQIETETHKICVDIPKEEEV